MTKEEVIKKLKKEAKKDTSWLKKAKWRRENRDWLDLSFNIALKTLTVLDENKKEGKSPKTQKELAKEMDCSPQYISKLVKGKEKLQIDTIAKLESALGVKMIRFAGDDESNQELKQERPNRSSAKRAAAGKRKIIKFSYRKENQRDTFENNNQSKPQTA